MGNKIKRGQVIGGYHIEDIIGYGGFGMVWRARHERLDSPVAIKVIDIHRLDQERLERVKYECQIGGKLTHKAHVVEVRDAFREDDYFLIVMELMTGGSLLDYLKQPRHPDFALTLDWALSLCSALEEVHDLKIIHRDIKPENILLTGDMQVKLGDFGVAHLPSSNLTTSSQPGTDPYKAPEQEANQPVDGRTDVYSLCAVLFEVWAGKPYCSFKKLDRSIVRQEMAYLLAQNYPDLAPRLHKELIDTVLAGLCPHPERISLTDLQVALRMIQAAWHKERSNDKATGIESVEPEARPDTSPEVVALGTSKKITEHRPLPFFAVGLSLVLLAIAGWLIWPWLSPLWLSKPTATPTVLSLANRAAPPISPSPTDTSAPEPLTATPSLTPTPTPESKALLTPTSSPIPTFTPSPTVTPTPYLTVNDEKLEVYTGPGKMYDILGQVQKGSRLPILGCSQDGRWWQVYYLGWYGWIPAQFVATDANPQALPVIETSPTPVNRPPNVEKIQPEPVTVEAWHAITVTCRASDLDNDELTFTWEVSDGFITGEGESVAYNAPEIIGTQTITVTVRDEHGSEVKHPTHVQVMPARPSPGTSEPVGVFGQIWHEHSETRRKLGWATGEENTTFGAEELFERGVMFWREDMMLIYVLAQGGKWQTYEAGKWQEGMDEYSCPEVAPRDTPPTPRRGIGKIWCEQLGGPEAEIGWATNDEEGYYAHWQNFEHGFMWGGHDGYIYVFYDDNTWQSYPHP
jgi:serine/threonine protein kinase